MMLAMTWIVILHPAFKAEYEALPEAVRMQLDKLIDRLRQFGPQLGRDAVDTLKGSRYANMKELRFEADGGVWRVAFLFDKRRICVILAIDNKAGKGERRFYQRLIATAEARCVPPFVIL